MSDTDFPTPRNDTGAPATNIPMSVALRRPAKQRVALTPPGYIRGDGAAGQYLGFIDPKGRTFREWAKEMKIPYALICDVAHYKIADLDKAWERAAKLTRIVQQS
jgi:hypothetical protein